MEQEDILDYIDKKTLNLIISAMRKSFAYHSDDYQTALQLASTSSGPRGGLRYQCAHCKHLFTRNLIDVDHKRPFIPLDSNPSEMTLKTLYNRLFTTTDNLSILCKECHKLKSKLESKQRAEFRHLKKPKPIKHKKLKGVA